MMGSTDRRQRYTSAQRERLQEVARLRAAIPSDKELARELGITVAAVRRQISYARRAR